MNTTSLGGGSSTGGPTLATGTFDQVSRQGAWPAGRWTGQDIQGTMDDALPASAQGFTQAGDRLTVSGSGDIAPATGNVDTVKQTLAGTFAGLIAVVVIGVMFITAEYRRGLIRTTLAASPRRGRVLAAKAVVLAAVTFAAGLVAAVIVIPVGERLLHESGNPIPPVTALTWLQVMVGTAALLAVSAVLGLAVGTLLRRSAGAVTAVIVGIVLPYLLATVPGILPVGAEQWLLRVTPAAGFAVQQTLTQYPQVSTVYTPGTGYFPLAAVGRVRGAVRLGRGRPGPRAVPAPPEGRVTDVVHAEWTKLRTLPGTGWLLLAAAALTAAVGAIAANAMSCPAGSCQIDPAKVSLTGIDLGQAIVAIVAVTVVSGEYSTGMIRTTLTATPRRWRVLAAKAAVVGAATLAAGAVAVLASVLAGGLLLDRHGLTPAHGYEALSLGNGTVLRAAAGSVLYLGLIALLSLGVAAAVRDSAVAIGVVLALLFLFPILSSVITSPGLHRHLEQLSPMTAGLYIQATTNLRSLPLTPWQGLGVLAAWTAGAMLAGALLLRFRDA